jgi:hypothetical protein
MLMMEILILSNYRPLMDEPPKRLPSKIKNYINKSKRKVKAPP